jgi:hypothetical protein
MSKNEAMIQEVAAAANVVSVLHRDHEEAKRAFDVAEEEVVKRMIEAALPALPALCGRGFVPGQQAVRLSASDHFAIIAIDHKGEFWTRQTDGRWVPGYRATGVSPAYIAGALVRLLEQVYNGKIQTRTREINTTVARLNAVCTLLSAL